MHALSRSYDVVYNYDFVWTRFRRAEPSSPAIDHGWREEQLQRPGLEGTWARAKKP